MDTAVSVELFVEILNRYVYYFDQQNETVRHPFNCLGVSLLTFLGNDEISEWAHRAYSFKSPN